MIYMIYIYMIYIYIEIMGNGKLKCLDIRYHILDLTEFLWEVEGSQVGPEGL